MLRDLTRQRKALRVRESPCMTVTFQQSIPHLLRGSSYSSWTGCMDDLNPVHNRWENMTCCWNVRKIFKAAGEEISMKGRRLKAGLGLGLRDRRSTESRTYCTDILEIAFHKNSNLKWDTCVTLNICVWYISHITSDDRKSRHSCTSAYACWQSCIWQQAQVFWGTF